MTDVPALDIIELATALIRRPSVTPRDDGALDLVEVAAKRLGFATVRIRSGASGEPEIDNLFARWGRGRPCFAYAGHTDVVPSGPEELWSRPPFGGLIEDGQIWGRGAADMKGGIAAFLGAAERAIAAGAVSGSIALLITGDEEGPALHGTRKILDWMAAEGETIDHCLVGEPTSSAVLGDMIKIGRRGSLSATLRVIGRQGHVGYPERARNPAHALAHIVDDLARTSLDQGFAAFPPSGLQFTDLHVGNPAGNVIPAAATARFNVRFNPTWTGLRLEAELRDRIAALCAAADVKFELDCVVSGEAFLTEDTAFVSLVCDAITASCGRPPEPSTTGGTSDARFIAKIAPVVEFGLVGATIHQIDEHAAVADVLRLTGIYETILRRYFAQSRP